MVLDRREQLRYEQVMTLIESMIADNKMQPGDRLPTNKELQTLVDYTRSPGATDPARVGPAIDPLFSCTAITNEVGRADYPWYWTSTSARGKANEPDTSAWYVAFGRAVNEKGEDLHGAGAVRFDAKVLVEGKRSQDAERTLNYVRLVRNSPEGK